MERLPGVSFSVLEPRRARGVVGRSRSQGHLLTAAVCCPLRSQVITMMDEYRAKSLEELRWEDYQQNLKGKQQGQQVTGAFGAAPFGQTQQQPPASPFGGSTAFGTTGTTGAFGSTTTSATPFGQPQQQQQANPFGAPAAGAFGSTATTATPFGQPQQQQQTGFGFGQQPQQSTSPFGAPAAGASPFGAPAAGTAGGLFGSTATTATPFGQPQQQQQQANPFGAKPATTGFSFGGSTTTPAAPASTGLFGSTQPTATTSAFGQPQQPAAPGAFSFGGAAQPQQQQPATGAFGTGGSLFGGANQQKPPTTGFSFGGSSTTPAAPASTGLFGSTQPAAATAPSTGFGGFSFGGTTTQQPQQQQQPATSGFSFGGLGGSATTSTPSFSFGGATGGTTGGGLFGSVPAAATTATGGGAAPFSFSLGGTQQAQPAAQPATVTTAPFGNLPEVPKGPGDVAQAPSYSKGLSQRPRKMNVQTRPQVVLATRTIAAKPANGAVLAPGGTAANLRPFGLGLVRSRPLVLPDLAGTEGGAALGGGMHRTGSRSTLLLEAPFGSEPSFAPHPASQAVRAAEMAAGMSTPPRAARPAAQDDHLLEGDARKGGAGVSSPSLAGGVAVNGAEDGLKSPEHAREPKAVLLPRLTRENYYTGPSIDELRRMASANPDYLSRVPNFCVGCKGLGEVYFPGETDVRGLNLDEIVDFHSQPGNLRMYLNEGVTKPPVGTQLNKRAEIKLFGIRRRKANDSGETLLLLTYPPNQPSLLLFPLKFAMHGKCAQMRSWSGGGG